MKTYEIELRRTSYTVVTVEAENEEAAETLAWAELDKRWVNKDGYGDWAIESVEEL